MTVSPDRPHPPMDALRLACQRIAPNWPLDQLIAVNPWWGWRDQPFSDASARLSALGHVHCLMDAENYRAQWQHTLTDADLADAAQALAIPLTAQQLREEHAAPPPRYWCNISDLVDATRPPSAMRWHEEIIHQLSQFCGDLLQKGHTDELDADRFYEAWLDVTRADRGLAILMDEPRLPAAFAALPNRVEDLVALAMRDLAHSPEAVSDYGLALLLDINGWAASLAWLNWQANLKGGSNDTLLGLLAARLAWDWVLWQLHPDAPWHSTWQQQWHTLPTLVASHRIAQQKQHVWQRAAERATQLQLARQLVAPWPEPSRTDPVVQAAFCIDVRSEVIRRALEAQHPGIQTLGFAGFFGLPIAYQPHGSTQQRPQLPGLLAPRLVVTDSVDPGSQLAQHTRQRNQWARFSAAAPTTFTAVESGGLFYLFKLLKQTLMPGKPTHPVNRFTADTRFTLSENGHTLSIEQKATLAAGVLKAMGLTGPLAPRVLLVGHGSTSCNNPHAAGLDCGACGGQTGEINVRVLAQLLNDTQVRQALVAHGFTVPDQTRFVPALHDTTTDDIQCFPEQSGDLDAPLLDWLEGASKQARQERAPALGLAGKVPAPRLKAKVIERSRDWSQVRPEWGLAGNHSFIVAPRQRTRHLTLAGRTFLHDYHWQQDTDFSLLELIMTAPMVVTHWINMQYNASVTDPIKFGSGNKVLHNVVGGHLGVFEGHGGDLRIGLPLQSVHNGTQWMHQPLRLSVFIAAPEAAIERVYQQHSSVRELVDNAWLYLFRLGDAPGEISQLAQQRWHALEERRLAVA